MTFTLQLTRHRRTRPPTPSRGGRRGFTVLELLTVLMVMGTLGRIAVPNVHELVLQARAQEVAGKLSILHLAALDYQQDEGTWPADAYAGEIPDGLQPYLPEGFTLQGEGYQLDWESWMLADGLPDAPDVEEILAVSVVTGELPLGDAVTDLLGGALAYYVLDDRYTFVLTRR